MYFSVTQLCNSATIALSLISFFLLSAALLLKQNRAADKKSLSLIDWFAINLDVDTDRVAKGGTVVFGNSGKQYFRKKRQASILEIQF